MTSIKTANEFNQCAAESSELLGVSKQAVHKACEDLFFWQYAPSDSFTNLLFIMFQKSDHSNKLRLKRGFPEHWLAWHLWQNCESQDKFFEFAGVGWPEKGGKE